VSPTPVSARTGRWISKLKVADAAEFPPASANTQNEPPFPPFYRFEPEKLFVFELLLFISRAARDRYFAGGETRKKEHPRIISRDVLKRPGQ
jgi:hypothetical protein